MKILSWIALLFFSVLLQTAEAKFRLRSLGDIEVKDVTGTSGDALLVGSFANLPMLLKLRGDGIEVTNPAPDARRGSVNGVCKEGVMIAGVSGKDGFLSYNDGTVLSVSADVLQLKRRSTVDAISGSCEAIAGRVGRRTYVASADFFPFAWPQLPGTPRRVDPIALSYSGDVIVANATRGEKQGKRSNGVLVCPFFDYLPRLVEPANVVSRIADLEPNGEIAVGSLGSGLQRQAAAWAISPDCSTQRLEVQSPEGTTSAIYTTSTGGDISGGTVDGYATLWTRTDTVLEGPFLVEELLSQNGIDLTGWLLLSITQISWNGNVLVGRGVYNGKSVTFLLEYFPEKLERPRK